MVQRRPLYRPPEEKQSILSISNSIIVVFSYVMAMKTPATTPIVKPTFARSREIKTYRPSLYANHCLPRNRFQDTRKKILENILELQIFLTNKR